MAVPGRIALSKTSPINRGPTAGGGIYATCHGRPLPDSSVSVSLAHFSSVDGQLLKQPHNWSDPSVALSIFPPHHTPGPCKSSSDLNPVLLFRFRCLHHFHAFPCHIPPWQGMSLWAYTGSSIPGCALAAPLPMNHLQLSRNQRCSPWICRQVTWHTT